MPGRNPPDKAVDENLCKRCQLVEHSILVRNEALCKACFMKYVQTKVVKRMESFRVRNSGPGLLRKLLLPLSMDAASLGLLHILSRHLKGQVEKSGRPGYMLYVLHIHERSSTGPAESSPLASVESLYPEHDFQSVSITQALMVEDVRALFPPAATSNEERLADVLASPKSATSRQDLKSILVRRLIVQQAKDSGCEAVLWADTTTKLAEKTLAETSKGRGFALPWTVADGESPHGISFYYPLREVMNKEVNSYISCVGSAVEELVVRREKPAVSTKNTTIDDLMAQYFESVEQDYPSIVANVVRTTGKLQPPSLTEVEQQCELCTLPLTGQAPAMSRLCYGCIRTLPQASD